MVCVARNYCGELTEGDRPKFNWTVKGVIEWPPQNKSTGSKGFSCNRIIFN